MEDGAEGNNAAEGEQMSMYTGEDINVLLEYCTLHDGTGVTRHTLSWIWMADAAPNSQETDSNDILCAEWTKSQVHAAQSTEEVALLREEMRCVLAFLEWKASWWESRQRLRAIDSMLEEGICAYATGQAELQCALQTSFRKIWQGSLGDEDEDLNAEKDGKDTTAEGGQDSITGEGGNPNGGEDEEDDNENEHGNEGGHGQEEDNDGDSDNDEDKGDGDGNDDDEERIREIGDEEDEYW